MLPTLIEYHKKIIKKVLCIFYLLPTEYVIFSINKKARGSRKIFFCGEGGLVVVIKN